MSKSKRVKKLNSMATLSKIIVLWWLFITSQFPFGFIAPKIMTEQKGKGYQEIREFEVFEYENTRSEFNQVLRLPRNLKNQGPKGHFQKTLPLKLIILH